MSWPGESTLRRLYVFIWIIWLCRISWHVESFIVLEMRLGGRSLRMPITLFTTKVISQYKTPQCKNWYPHSLTRGALPTYPCYCCQFVLGDNWLWHWIVLTSILHFSALNCRVCRRKLQHIDLHMFLAEIKKTSFFL